MDGAGLRMRDEWQYEIHARHCQEHLGESSMGESCTPWTGVRRTSDADLRVRFQFRAANGRWTANAAWHLGEHPAK